jgi:hypothetical protein
VEKPMDLNIQLKRVTCFFLDVGKSAALLAGAAHPA